MSTVMLPAVRETEVETPEKSVKEGLEKALAVLREGGWVRGVASTPNGRGGMRHCALGAVYAVRQDDPVYYTQMALALLGAIGKEPDGNFTWNYLHEDGTKSVFVGPDTSAVARWNDAPERTQDEVEMIFEYAIEKAEN